MANVLFPQLLPLSPLPSPLLSLESITLFSRTKMELSFLSFFNFATFALTFTAERKWRALFWEWELERASGTWCGEYEVSFSARRWQG